MVGELNMATTQKNYDILLFDADDTIFDFKAGEKTALAETLKEFALPVNDEILTLYHQINDKLWKDFEKGVYSDNFPKHLRFEQLLEILGKSCDAVKMNEVYISHLAEQSVLMKGADSVCKVLSETHSLYIVTNGTATVQHSRFDSSPVRKYFSDMFISSEIGSRKPEREFFQTVFKKIKPTDLSRVIIIGDSLSSDISGGINAGIDTCWFNPLQAPHPEDVCPTYEITALDQLYSIV